MLLHIFSFVRSVFEFQSCNFRIPVATKTDTVRKKSAFIEHFLLSFLLNMPTDSLDYIYIYNRVIYIYNLVIYIYKYIYIYH